MKLTVGTTLQNGRYTINSVLGQSGLGITLKATQASLNQPVVLKTLQPNSKIPTDFAKTKQRFIEDARRFASCQHPGIVRLLDVFEEEGLPFAVMDFVAGQSLAERVQNCGPLSEAQAIQYVRQAGSALSAVHKYGLVHRNIQPSTLVRPPGADFVVLADYGMADWADATGAERILPGENFRAIEQYQTSMPLTPATDIYALAATLYFLVTGQPPTASFLREKSPLPALRTLQPGISSMLESAILSGMALNAQLRPQTITAWFAQFPGHELLPPAHRVTGQETRLQERQTKIQQPDKAELAATQHRSANSNGNSSNGIFSNGIFSNGNTPGNSSSQATASQLPGYSPAKHAAAVVALPVRRSRLPKVLVGTAAIAASVGLGLGLTLRFGAATGMGPKIFHTQQNFPPQADWPGAAQPVAAPIEPLPRVYPIRRNPASISPKPVVSPPSPSPSPDVQPSPEGSQPLSDPATSPETVTDPVLAPNSVPLQNESPQVAPSPPANSQSSPDKSVEGKIP